MASILFAIGGFVSDSNHRDLILTGFTTIGPLITWQAFSFWDKLGK